MEPKIVSGRGGVMPGVEVNPVTGERTRLGVPANARAEMNKWVSKNGLKGVFLDRSQRESMNSGVKCYIYNTSPIFQWERRLDRFGIFLIPKAPTVGDIIIDKISGEQRHATKADVDGDYKLSAPIVIQHSYIRPYDAGEGQMKPKVEYGENIAEDLVGCSDKYPADLTKGKDLTKKGVFITYGIPFEECEPEQQQALLQKAHIGHDELCRKKVIKGDQLFEQSKITGKGGPLEMHRQCAVYLNLTDRPWVTNRGSVYGQDTNTQSCPFCASSIKLNIPKCPVCKETIDEELLAKTKAEIKARKKAAE